MPDVYKDSKSTGRWWGIVGSREVVSAAIRVDELEYFDFDIFELRKKCDLLASKVVYDDFGVRVYHFDDDASFYSVFRGIKRACKMLQQAEQANRARIYRERRG